MRGAVALEGERWRGGGGHAVQLWLLLLLLLLRGGLGFHRGRVRGVVSLPLEHGGAAGRARVPLLGRIAVAEIGVSPSWMWLPPELADEGLELCYSVS